MRTPASTMAATAALAIVLAACSSSGTKVTTAPPKVQSTTSTTRSSGSGSGGTPETIDGTIASTAPTHHLGQTQTAEGGAAATLEVTPTKIIDPGTPATSQDQAQPGTRLVGVVLTIKNTGTAPADIEPGSDLLGYGHDGTAFLKAFSATNIKECTGSPEPVTIEVGQTLDDCIVLGVTTADEVTSLQWMIEGVGNHPDPLVWAVP